jgi:hypothetical protein
MITCKTCNATLGRGNKTGRCKRCVGAWVASQPGWREKQRDGARRSLMENPERLADLRKRAKALGRDKSVSTKRSAHFIERRIWEMGSAAQGAGSAARIKAGKTLSETRMAWCPRELRADYFNLVRSKGMKAAEAKALILDQHKVDVSRFRRSLGDVDEPANDWTPPDVDPALPLEQRALAYAAKWAGVAVAQVTGPLRANNLVRARWIVMLTLRRQGWSLKSIAALLGLSDHTTVKYGLKCAAPLIDEGGDFAAVVEAIAA